MSEVLAWRVFRTGYQSLERDGERYFVTLRNRTNDTRVEVPAEKVPEWLERLTPRGQLQ